MLCWRLSSRWPQICGKYSRYYHPKHLTLPTVTWIIAPKGYKTIGSASNHPNRPSSGPTGLSKLHRVSCVCPSAPPYGQGWVTLFILRIEHQSRFPVHQFRLNKSMKGHHI
ncbi:unnamed protein product [Somion occarium]|uniref:Uncharacterized protein n=1 Tax=Somion occarium TaxID=3059160 RepID=A0ABP1DG63_9APHY